MCGCLGAVHCGQAVSVVGVAFQFARRERVLERDVFRFGTATSVPLLFVTAGMVCGRWQPCSAAHRGSITSWWCVRVLREMRSALGAQSRAVLPAHRLERQGGHHCVPERGFEVEQVAHELTHFVLVVIGAHLLVVLRTIGVGEQVLEVRRHRRR